MDERKDERVQHWAEVLWNFHILREPLERCDTIIGLGSYDLGVARRAADLYREGLAQLVLFTGREGNWTRDRFADSEARRFRDEAIRHGVDAGDILLEEAATNLGQNIQFSDEILLARLVRSVVVVTKPQTQRRVRLTADRIGRLERYIVTAPLCDLYESLRNFGVQHVVSEMVGDLDRIVKYPAAGFSRAEHVPAEVMLAFRTLCEMGFTEHCLH